METFKNRTEKKNRIGNRQKNKPIKKSMKTRKE